MVFFFVDSSISTLLSQSSLRWLVIVTFTTPVTSKEIESIDVFLVKNGYYETRNKAQNAIISKDIKEAIIRKLHM